MIRLLFQMIRPGVYVRRLGYHKMNSGRKRFCQFGLRWNWLTMLKGNLRASLFWIDSIAA
jgi:hypothetical protein